MKAAHLPPVIAWHLWVQEGQRLFRPCERGFKVKLPLFQHEHLGIQPVSRTAAEDHFNKHVEIPINFLYFRLGGVNRLTAS